MTKPEKKGIARIFQATLYSLQGLTAAWKQDAAFRLDVLIVAVGLPLAWWLAKDKFELLWLIMPLFLLIMSELINSAIEATVDRIGLEHHELAGRAKDIASAIVMIAIFLLLVVWSVILFL